MAGEVKKNFDPEKLANIVKLCNYKTKKKKKYKQTKVRNKT